MKYPTMKFLLESAEANSTVTIDYGSYGVSAAGPGGYDVGERDVPDHWEIKAAHGTDEWQEEWIGNLMIDIMKDPKVKSVVDTEWTGHSGTTGIYDKIPKLRWAKKVAATLQDPDWGRGAELPGFWPQHDDDDFMGN